MARERGDPIRAAVADVIYYELRQVVVLNIAQAIPAAWVKPGDWVTVRLDVEGSKP